MKSSAEKLRKQGNSNSVNNRTIDTEIHSDILLNAGPGRGNVHRNGTCVPKTKFVKTESKRTPFQRGANKKARGFLIDSAIPRKVSDRRT